MKPSTRKMIEVFKMNREVIDLTNYKNREEYHFCLKVLRKARSHVRFKKKVKETK